MPSELDPVHTPTSHFLKFHLNIILPSTPGSYKWSLSLRFTHQNPVYASSLPHTPTCHAHLILLDFITRTVLGEQCRSVKVPHYVVYIVSAGKYDHLSHCHENPKSRNYITDVGVIKYCVNICNCTYSSEGNVHVFLHEDTTRNVSTRFSFQFPISQVKKPLNLPHSVLSTLTATRQYRAVPLSFA